MYAYLIAFVQVLFQVLTFAIFARVLLSWFPVRPDNPIVQILNEVTDPILRPLRRIIPPLGMLDISPIVALFLVQIVGNMLVSALGG